MDAADFPAVLRRAQDGDPDAFAALFRMAGPAVLRYLQALAGNQADDLAGETWLQVVRGLRSFVGHEPAAFRAWVVSIARHRWLDDQRSRGRRPELPVADVPDGAAVRDAGALALEVISTESAVAMIGRLPTDQAEVLMLRVVADLDVATTARIVGKAPGTVRVLAHRGLRRLRDLLAAEEAAGAAVTERASGSVTSTR